MKRVLWIALLIAGAAAAIGLVALSDSGWLRKAPDWLRHLDGSDLGILTLKIVFLVLVGAAAITAFHGSFLQALRSAALWVVIALALVAGYTYRHDLRDVAERVRAELVPGYAAARGRTVELARGNTGNFAVSTRINGARIPMVLDTGASSVVLTYEAARAAGLPVEMAIFSVPIDTANGRTRAAPVTLDRVAVGNLEERSVSALIAQPGQLKVSLLGMTFLNRLESWEVRGDKLLLRGYP